MERKANGLLIVADKPADKHDLRQLLKDSFELSFVAGADDALETLKGLSTVDLLLIVDEPRDMGNLELLRTVRDDKTAGDLAVVVLSSSASPEDIASALEAGATDHISRPIGARALKARLTAQLKIRDLLQAQRKQIDQLAWKEEQRLNLVRMASHDLKSPLNNIRLAEAIVRRTASERLEVAQSLDMIRLMVDSMGGIISNYLDVIELHAGHLQVKLKPISLKDVVTNVVSQYSFAARKKSIQLQVKADDGWVIADTQRLVQVLGNLVSNAIKYSPYHSEVTIVTTNQDECGVIMVADAGPGILTEERDRLFQEFGRLSTRPTGGESSSGLGLWIVKQLIEAQNGTVGADFPKAGGSRFWVALPTSSPRADISQEPVKKILPPVMPANLDEPQNTPSLRLEDDSEIGG